MALADLRTCSSSFSLLAFTAVLLLGPIYAAQAESDASIATPTSKDPRIGSLIETLVQTKVPTEAAISPDGSTAAWTVRIHGNTQIHLSDAANPDPAKEKIVSTGSGATDCSSSDAKWS